VSTFKHRLVLGRSAVRRTQGRPASEDGPPSSAAPHQMHSGNLGSDASRPASSTTLWSPPSSVLLWPSALTYGAFLVGAVVAVCIDVRVAQPGLLRETSLTEKEPPPFIVKGNEFDADPSPQVDVPVELPPPYPSFVHPSLALRICARHRTWQVAHRILLEVNSHRCNPTFGPLDHLKCRLP